MREQDSRSEVLLRWIIRDLHSGTCCHGGITQLPVYCLSEYEFVQREDVISERLLTRQSMT